MYSTISWNQFKRCGMGVFWAGLGCGQFVPEVLQKSWHLHAWICGILASVIVYPCHCNLHTSLINRSRAWSSLVKLDKFIVRWLHHKILTTRHACPRISLLGQAWASPYMISIYYGKITCTYVWVCMCVAICRPCIRHACSLDAATVLGKGQWPCQL